MMKQADDLKTKFIKTNIFKMIKDSVFTATAIYRTARVMWKTLAFKRTRKYLTKISRITLLLSLAYKKFITSSTKLSIKRYVYIGLYHYHHLHYFNFIIRLKAWKLQKWRKDSYLRTELGNAKHTMMIVINALKKWQRYVSISSIWGSSLVKTMMHLFQRVFVRLSMNVRSRKRLKAEKGKFLLDRKRLSFDSFMRFSYTGQYLNVLKKNKSRVKNNNAIFEQQNIYHSLYRLSFFGDFRVSKQRLIYQKATKWRVLVKISKKFIGTLIDMKRNKKRNIRRTKHFKAYLLLREFYRWNDLVKAKKQRRLQIIHMLKQFKKRYSLNWLRQYAHLKKLHRCLTHTILQKRLTAWKVHRKSRTIAKKVFMTSMNRVNESLIKVYYYVIINTIIYD